MMNARPHILVACHAWYGDMIGGAFRLATEFAQHLAAADYQVSYVCCSNDGSPRSEDSQDGVNIFRYPAPPKGMNGFGKLRYHVRQTQQLCRRIHGSAPVTAVSSHSPLQGLGAAQAISQSGAFINYTVHSPFDDEVLSNCGPAGPGLVQRIAGHAARWVDRRNVALANRIQTVSSYTLDNFRNKYSQVLNSKGIVAPGWVDSDLFVPAEDRSNVRKNLGANWETDAPLLFTLRRLENRMGLDTLIHACRNLLSEGLHFRTLIGGSGSMRQQLQDMIDSANLSDHVQLLGRLPEEHLSAAYAAADCFVLPTKALECFGLIVLEAYACATPVIASAAAAIPELAERQGKEWMFEPGNVQQLTDRLRSFVTGRLHPTVDLRQIAMEYNRKDVLKYWESLLSPNLHTNDNAAEIDRQGIACGVSPED